MPTYEYACRECGQHLEVVQSFRDEALTTCGACGGPLRKVFSAAGIIFKGSGYYVTDTRQKQSKSSGDGKAATAGSKDGGRSESGDASPAPSESGDAKSDGAKSDGAKSGGAKSDGAKSSGARSGGSKGSGQRGTAESA